MATRSRQIRLVARPRGMSAPAELELAEVGLPDPAEGRNAFVVRMGPVA